LHDINYPAFYIFRDESNIIFGIFRYLYHKFKALYIFFNFKGTMFLSPFYTCPRSMTNDANILHAI